MAQDFFLHSNNKTMINNHNKDIFFNINITDTPMGMKGLCQEDEKVRSANVKVAAEGHSLADNERSPFSAFGNIEQFLCEDCLLITSLPEKHNFNLEAGAWIHF